MLEKLTLFSGPLLHGIHVEQHPVINSQVKVPLEKLSESFKTSLKLTQGSYSKRFSLTALLISIVKHLDIAHVKTFYRLYLTLNQYNIFIL